MFSLSTWMSNIDVDILISSDLNCVTTSKRSYEINNLKANVISELKQKYKGWHVLYTDGSKSSSGRGAAFYDPIGSLDNQDYNIFKVIGNVSVMTVELIAISSAISYIQDKGIRKAVIYTDSKSALQHLARSVSGHRGVPVAYEILDKVIRLQLNEINLRLQWVPAHIGLRGNEEADHLAKKGIVEGHEIYILPYYLEATNKFKIKCHEIWKEYFDERSREKVFVLHLMKKSDSPNCELCGTTEDVQHLLVECVRNCAAREALVAAANLSKYDTGMFVGILAQPASDMALMLFRLADVTRN
ncbi:uncharacterized protein [Choristoneura fumiferana]|uniref:uncharacterized protein n=1 Tax=Choristoneura fumiferana TaxID=7141 RepID=UPI003D1595A5